MLKVKVAEKQHFETVMKIYEIAREFMKENGNPTQWADSYPPEALIKSDIENGICHIICDGEEIKGVFALCDGEDPSYGYIENGEWPNSLPYLAIHRIASDGTAHGILSAAVTYASTKCDNLRIDTHDDNKIMQRQIEKNGFGKCGRIYVDDGSPRIAYHLTCKIKE